MPADFEKCVADGGRVRTKNLGDGKYMRICFLGGKSYAGEVRTKRDGESVEFDYKDGEFPESAPARMDCSLIFESKNQKIEEESRTVISGVLEEDILSDNDRFYPAGIVRQAIESLPGKKSLIGHDTDDPRDVVATISGAKMEGKIGYAAFKFGRDSISEMMFQKIKDGLINSVSIRAFGETRRAQLDEKFVDVIEKLDIFSVDWVLEGGIKSAKVARVFEQSPTITYDTETDNSNNGGLDKIMEEKLKKAEEDLSAALKKIEELTAQLKEKDDAVKARDAELLEAYKNLKLSTLSDKEVAALIKEQLTATSKEDIDKQFDKQIKLLEELQKKAKASVPIVKPVDEEHKEDIKTVDEYLASKTIKKEDKVKALKEIFR